MAIAGALVENPRVLLLDELTTFLDEADQAGVVRAVRNVVDSDSKVTAVWVTHRLEELRHCDAACYMEDGRVAEMGSGDYIRGYIRQQQRQWEGVQGQAKGVSGAVGGGGTTVDICPYSRLAIVWRFAIWRLFGDCFAIELALPRTVDARSPA